ncbi:MAG TPA: NHL repeat-containing protein [bacterium]|jgi:tripartite motif-containing protein 71|nr:NHL repeat-containing protein [bacterium]
MRKTKKSKSGKKNKRKPIGKGAKLFLMFFSAVFLVVVIYLFVDRIQDAINKSKTVLVPIDMQVGDTPESKFQEPKDVAVDSENNFYVSDFGLGVIKKFDPNGKLLLTIGKLGSHPGDDKGPGEFNQPSGLWVSQNGDIYVSDTFNHRVQVFDKKGKSLKVWAHSFFGPRDVVGDNNGKVYVVDTGNHKIQVFDNNGNFIKEFGGHGTSEGKFDEPVGCTVDSKGVLYVSDSNNNRIEKFDSNGKFLGSFKVSTWHGKNVEVPYITCYQDNIYASNASIGSVLKYDLNGKLIAVYKRKDIKDGFMAAQGVAVDNLNRVYVTQVGAANVVRFSLPVPVGTAAQ